MNTGDQTGITTEMSDSDQAELKRLLQIDSANMPNSMAVNQEQLASDASVEVPEPVRSKYFGVYTNTGNNKDAFQFRAALSMGQADKKRWMNLGYYNCEIVAAMAYNTAAINTFGAGAWLNPVNKDDANAEELQRFHTVRAGHIATASAKIKTLLAEGVNLQYVDLDARNDEVAAANNS